MENFDANTKEQHRFYIVAVHVLRPIGAQAGKQAGQGEVLGAWARGLLEREAGTTVVIAGGTDTPAPQPRYGVGREDGALNGFAATQLTATRYDRLAVAGPATWTAIEILRPPYGKGPNDTVKRVLTDHFFVGAALRVI